MKVSLLVHGGQAAALRLGRPATVVDSGLLPEDQARELAALTAAALAEHAETGARDRDQGATGSRAASPSRDATTSTVEVFDEDRVVVVRRSDVEDAPALQALVAWLRAHGSPAAR